MQTHTKSRLRAKTGCFACRLAKKKCDELTPTCRRCRDNNRKCKWPNAVDMFDRRSQCYQQARQQSKGISPDSSTEQTSSPKDDIDHVSEHPQVLANFETRDLISHEPAIVYDVTVRGIDAIVSRHFTLGFYELILLPGCHHGFSSGWLADISQLTLSCASLQYSILACAASHLYMIDRSASMQQLALSYYSSAITQLLRLLTDTRQPVNYDGLLSTIIFLNIHGCQGFGTYADVPRHIEAASRILQSRFFDLSETKKRLFDIVAVESVLYHAFHASTGLWSDNREPGYRFNNAFWKQAETFLHRSKFFPETTTSFNSPVLGVPPSLLRVALQLRQLYNTPLLLSATEIQDVQREALEWGYAFLLQMEPPTELEDCSRPANRREALFRDATALYTLTVSFLCTDVFKKTPVSSLEPASGIWQMTKALEIIRRNANDDSWGRCYLGNWPIYTLGFFMSNPEERRVIQADLQRRWELTRMAQCKRFLDDLEFVWNGGLHSG